MREMDFDDLQYPSLEDFQPYSYQDDYPEPSTTHHGLRFDVPGGGEAYFIIEYIEPRPDLEEPGGYVWYFQEQSGRSAEDLSGGFDTVEEAYASMRRQFDLETGRTEVFTMVVPDPSGAETHCSYSSLEACLRGASRALSAHDGSAIDFEVPIKRNGQPFGTLVHAETGWQLKDMNANDRAASLDDLIKEAREESMGKRQLEGGDSSRKPSELDLSGSSNTQTNTETERSSMRYKLEIEVDSDAIAESGLDAVNYIHQEMGWVADSGIRLINLEEKSEQLSPQREADIMPNADVKDEQAIDHPLDDLVKEAKGRLQSREHPDKNNGKKPPEPQR